MGHDDTVARRHYAQTLDSHFEKARRTESATSRARQQLANKKNGTMETAQKRDDSHGAACLVGPEGLEPPTKGL